MCGSNRRWSINYGEILIHKEIKELDLPGKRIAQIHTTSQIPQIGFYLFIGGTNCEGSAGAPALRCVSSPPSWSPRAAGPTGPTAIYISSDWRSSGHLCHLIKGRMRLQVSVEVIPFLVVIFLPPNHLVYFSPSYRIQGINYFKGYVESYVKPKTDLSSNWLNKKSGHTLGFNDIFLLIHN